MIIVETPRLLLKQFQLTDSEDVFSCITPSVTKFMPWEPPTWEEYVARCERKIKLQDPNKFQFVIRKRQDNECIGSSSLEDAASDSPKLGLWLKESAHGQRFGKEVVMAIAQWGYTALGKGSFTYPVATQNIASRRIAESMNGKIIGHSTNQKYAFFIYQISWPT